MASRTPKATAEAYFEAWRAKDFDAARGHLHDDLSFQGPFDSFNSAEDLISAITQLGGLVKTLEKRNVLVDGQDVCIIYDLVPVKDASNVGMAELYRVVDDKISAIRVIFDTAAFSAIF